MRIVQVINGLQPAGAERVVADLSCELCARGHEVSVVSLMSLPDGSPIVDELRTAGIPIHTLHLRKHNPWRLLGLAGLLQTLRPDVVHSHMFHSNVATRLSAPRSRRYKLMSTVHNVEPRADKRWLLALDRCTKGRCDLHTAVSASVRTDHARRLGIPPDDMPVVHNGIHPPKPLLPAEIEGLRREWGVSDCQRVMGTAGRLVPQKGFDILLRILRGLERFPDNGERWGLVILGQGSSEQDLRKLAREVPDFVTIRLPGFRPDAARCAGAFDLFLMPSRWEGFGLTLAEAMAHGIPVLANRLDSLVEVGGSYPNATFVDFTEQNRREILDAMVRILKGTGERHPAVPFTVDQMTTQYIELYEAMLE